MSNEPPNETTYEEKEERLDEILGRLDRSETPMDQLAAEAKEAAQLIMSMQMTLRSAKEEVAQVFADMDKQKDAHGLKAKADQDAAVDPQSDGRPAGEAAATPRRRPAGNRQTDPF